MHSNDWSTKRKKKAEKLFSVRPLGDGRYIGLTQPHQTAYIPKGLKPSIMTGRIMQVKIAADLSGYQPTHDIVEIARAPELASRTAVVLGEHVVSFGELNRRGDNVANGLRALIANGCAVAFLAQATPLFYEIMLGTARSGNVFLPLNWRLSLPELQEIVRLSAPRVLFADQTYRDIAVALRDTAETPLEVILIGLTGPH